MSVEELQAFQKGVLNQKKEEKMQYQNDNKLNLNTKREDSQDIFVARSAYKKGTKVHESPNF